jgi:hypothetical protein
VPAAHVVGLPFHLLARRCPRAVALHRTRCA